ncbi:uncharacterized protein LOC143018772 [Oratosquilla oratoria]|uniref:uncharacterized protein LOC143018772 n=1 Tax=Oratosquilla oratoria TaxID=337810 RepID=UPI003F76440A
MSQHTPVWALLLALSVGFLCLCIERDPGRGPWNKDNDLLDEELGFVDGFCPVCRFYQGPRDSHCSECRVCIREKDHHCPVLGVCIGGRNYPHYFGMLWSATLFHGLSNFATVANLVMTWGSEGGIGCQVGLLLVSLYPTALFTYFTENHTMRFFTHPHESCGRRFRKKVLSQPFPDLHSIFIEHRTSGVDGGFLDATAT